MKKVTALVLALLMTVTLLAACGSSGTAGGTAAGSAAASASGSAAASVKEKKFVFQCVGTDQGTDYITANSFADTVSKMSGGAMTIKVYGADQLAGGNTNKALEMLAKGEVDMGCYAQSVCANINPLIGICTLPWTFVSYDDVNEKMSGAAGEYLKKQFESTGIVWLDYTHNALRQLSNSKHTVATLADLKSLKIRVPGGNVFMDTWKALGADPTSMAWSEVFTALQQKTIDGQENGAKTSQSNSIEEVNKYWTVWNYAYDGYPLLVNKNVWDSLDATQQGILQDAAKEVCAASRTKVETDEEGIWASFEKDNGCEITRLTEDQLKPFQDAVASVVESYKNTFGKDAYDAFGIKW